MKRTGKEWSDYHDITILDPDGWRNTGTPWGERITEEKFWTLAVQSTIILSADNLYEDYVRYSDRIWEPFYTEEQLLDSRTEKVPSCAREANPTAEEYGPREEVPVRLDDSFNTHRRILYIPETDEPIKNTFENVTGPTYEQLKNIARIEEEVRHLQSLRPKG